MKDNHRSCYVCGKRDHKNYMLERYGFWFCCIQCMLKYERERT